MWYNELNFQYEITYINIMEFTAKEKAVVDQLRVWHNQISERLTRGSGLYRLTAIADATITYWFNNAFETPFS